MITHGEQKNKTPESKRLDLGLAILSCLLKPRETLTRYDIAAWCGCSRSAIYQIELKALRKVRSRLAPNDLADAEKFFAHGRQPAQRANRRSAFV